MAKPKLSNVLVISVEWGRSRGEDQRPVTDRLAGRLLDELEQRGFKATWGVPDLKHSAVTRIAQAAPSQELALDATIQTPTQPQHVPAFVRWLRDRRQRAEDVGIELRSLVLDARGCHPYQQLARIGLCTLRTNGGMTDAPVQPQPLRFGLYGLPVSQRWPHVRRHWASFWRSSPRRPIDLTRLSRAVAHVLIDLSAMASDADESLRQLQRFLDAAAVLRDRQGLRSACLVEIESMVRQETAVQPAKSILHKAA
jgi:hypothetical protein